MKQQTFSDIEYSNRRRKTKREEFLDSMDEMIPWDYWVSIIKPYYPSGKRGPEMHQTKKGNQWYHGMKVHSGVDAGSGYVHTITGTPANVHDIDETVKLVREDEHVVYGDSGYSGIGKRDEIKNDDHLSKVEFRINLRPSSIKVPDTYKGPNWDKEIENRKSSTRCKVEHPFLIVKRQFGYAKVAYRGIAKNMNRFHVLFASANLVMCARAGRSKEFCMA